MISGIRTALRGRAFSWARLLRLNWLARHGANQDLSPLVAAEQGVWRNTLDAARSGPRVVLATNSGGHFGLAAIDRVLALGLSLRGAHAVTVFCDGVLPACLLCELNIQPNVARFAAQGPSRLLCGFCHAPAARATSTCDLPVSLLGEYVTATDQERAQAFAAGVHIDSLRTACWNDIPVGEHAHAGALRYFARGALAGEPQGEAVARRFLAGAIVAAIGYGRLFDRVSPDVVVAHHGIYAPQGVVAALARARGIRVVTWNPAYRRHCFIFSHNDTYHHTLMEEPTERWDHAPLDARQRQRIIDYLLSRREGREDWIRWHKDPDYGARVRLVKLGLDPDKPLVAAFTNVFWDAQLHYPHNAFVDQTEWLTETIRFFAARPDLQLVIRVHPAEVSGNPPSRQRAADEIATLLPRLPPNVAIVPPESALSSYLIAEMANAVLIYATKMGVELAAMGMPVVVAGEAWVRNKGFTEDIRSKQHYRDVLAGLPFDQRLDDARRERALAYAHHFFFRRMIPLPFVEPDAGTRRFTIRAASLDRLGPGADPGLDAICRGILEGAPFEA